MVTGPMSRGRGWESNGRAQMGVGARALGAGGGARIHLQVGCADPLFIFLGEFLKAPKRVWSFSLQIGEQTWIWSWAHGRLAWGGGAMGLGLWRKGPGPMAFDFSWGGRALGPWPLTWDGRALGLWTLGPWALWLGRRGLLAVYEVVTSTSTLVLQSSTLLNRSWYNMVFVGSDGPLYSEWPEFHDLHCYQHFEAWNRLVVGTLVRQLGFLGARQLRF